MKPPNKPTTPTPDAVARRWADAIEIGRRNRIPCTVWKRCPNWAGLAMFAGRDLVAFVCREHAKPAFQDLLARGISGVNGAALADMLEVFPPSELRRAARVLRNLL